ncbi:MAG: sialidase family protein, partial [Planctomycetota bacterium]
MTDDIKSAGPVAGDWGEPEVILTAPQGWEYNHLSWPKVTRTPHSNVVLACSAGVGHLMGGSGLTVSVSRDGGRSFSSPEMLRSFPQFDDRYHDCGNYAIGTAGDGAIVLLAMAFNRKQKRNTIFGFRSEDEGHSWQTVDTENLAENKTGSVYGHIFPLPKGKLGVVGHYRPGSKPHESGIWMSVSGDEGLSWSPAKCIIEGNYVEPAVIYTDRGFIGLLRRDNGRDFYTLAVSEDGEEWQLRAN